MHVGKPKNSACDCPWFNDHRLSETKQKWAKFTIIQVKSAVSIEGIIVYVFVQIKVVLEMTSCICDV
jgi:hypothetical protein